MPSVRAYGDDASIYVDGSGVTVKFQCPRCGRTAMMRVSRRREEAWVDLVSMPSVRAYGDDARAT